MANKDTSRAQPVTASGVADAGGADGALRRRGPAEAPAVGAQDSAAPVPALPIQRPLGPLAAALARPALTQLRRMAAVDAGHNALYEQRARAVCERYAELSLTRQVTLALRRMLDAVCLLRSWLTGIIHPATVYFTDAVLPDDALCDTLVTRKLARRIHFFTRDHVLLDGLLVGHTSDTPLPVAVLGLGNCMHYEQFAIPAAELALKQGVRVLLYNDRGVGRSTGCQRNISQAVLDCRGALQAALARSNGSIDVFGISLSGGKTAIALQQAQAAGELTQQQVRTYVNCHSFTSLSGCIGQLLGVAVGWAARAVFAVGGMDNLNAERALKSGRLAQKTVLLTAKQDEIIRGSARLHTAFEGSNAVVGVESHSFDVRHNDLSAYFEAGTPQLRAWQR